MESIDQRTEQERVLVLQDKLNNLFTSVVRYDGEFRFDNDEEPDEQENIAERIRALLPAEMDLIHDESEGELILSVREDAFVEYIFEYGSGITFFGALADFLEQMRARISDR
jgi:hypothetical protein